MEENLEETENPQRPREVPRSDLLRLPLELRLEIYYYCIPRKRLVDICAHKVKRPRFHLPSSFSDHSYSESSNSESSLSESSLSDCVTDSEDAQEETDQEGDLKLDGDVR